MTFKIIGVAVLLVAGYLLATRFGAPQPVQEIIRKLPGQEFNLDSKKAKIDLNKLRQGCPVKDCIPAIDNPEFISATDAEKQNQITDDDVVFAVFHKGVAKAYPQRILNWHEIVNDTVGGDPILVTFCPLCGTALGFERPADTTFGVSGKLVNSNLVMYDRKTETLWQQLGGEAIVGELVGQKLKPFPVDTLLWKDWKKLHPDTQVLSQDTGYSRDYSVYPYGSYETDRSVYFPAEGTQDSRLHPKQIVWGIEVEGKFKAYDDKRLSAVGVVNDTLNGVNLKIERSKVGQVRITKEDGSQVIPDRSMWFAWVSFHPETELFK
ncbi:DUF3179 domain-containing protein [Candidatus Microgenomates bacterium]|nr:DUF3179 domain-containing protein [Candidatus Microgenomates bacterium]